MFLGFLSTASYNFQRTEPVHFLFLKLLGNQMNFQIFHEHLLCADTGLGARSRKIKYKAFQDRASEEHAFSTDILASSKDGIFFLKNMDLPVKLEMT